MLFRSVTAVIIPNAGHWLMEEARDRTVGEIVKFVERPPVAAPAKATTSP